MISMNAMASFCMVALYIVTGLHDEDAIAGTDIGYGGALHTRMTRMNNDRGSAAPRD